MSLAIQVHTSAFISADIILGPHEKTLELQLRQFISCLMHRNLNPRSLVQIVIQVLSVDTTAVNPVCISIWRSLTR